MAQSKKNQHYEVLVIGADLGGLLISEALHQAGHDVAIFEAGDRAASYARPLLGPKGPLPAHFDYIPNSDSSRDLLSWLSQLLQSEILQSAEDNSPMHFEEGRLKSFVGFGERNFASRDEIDFYISPERIRTTPELSAVADQLAEKWTSKIQFRKETTRLLFDSHALTGVEINGDEILTANSVIFTGGPRALLDLSPGDSIEGRHRTRLAKAPTWATVSLHLHHSSPIGLERGIHVLFGSGQVFEPVLGRVWPAQADGSQYSLWMTLVGQEVSDDSEQLSHALKHLKRQLKRAYEGALTDLKDEKLLVSPESHGQMNLKTKEEFRLSESPNLWLASHLLSPLKGPLASIDMAKRLSEAFLGTSSTAQAATTTTAEAPAEANP